MRDTTEIRLRDAAVGGLACLLFVYMAFSVGQLTLESTLTAIVLGYVSALASQHLWHPALDACAGCARRGPLAGEKKGR